jgi:serine protease Do
MRYLIGAALAVACAGAPAAYATLLAPADLPDLVEKVLPGVVNISSTVVTNYYVFGWQDFLRGWGVPETRKQSSLGSGLLIDKNGFVLTNNHVVEHADEVVVTLIDKRAYKARIIGTDPKMDLALLQIHDRNRKPPEGLLALTLGDSEAVRIAEPVFAVGNPFGLQHTVTIGIISAKHRTIGLGPFDNFLQTDASINPGNSGGPLFNLKGQVIGINTVIRSNTGQSGGIGFAIPVNEAKQVLEDLKKYGRVPRPWLGILAERVTPQLQSYYHLPSDRGVIIYNLVEQGPADVGGIRLGDILTRVDGTDIEEPNDIERALSHHRPTDSVTIQVRRARKKLDFKLRLEELPRRIDHLPAGII